MGYKNLMSFAMATALAVDAVQKWQVLNINGILRFSDCLRLGLVEPVGPLTFVLEPIFYVENVEPIRLI